MHLPTIRCQKDHSQPRPQPWHTSDPGTHLAPAHIWPRHTSGPGTHLTPAHIWRALSPIPILPRIAAASPREGGTDGFPVPRLDGRPRPYLMPRHRAGRREPGGPVPAPPWLPSQRQAGRRLRAWRHRGSIYEAFPPRAGRQQQSAPGTRGRRLCRGWIGVKREAGRSPPQRAGRTLPLAAPARET